MNIHVHSSAPLIAALPLLASVVAGCGPDARRVQANETVRLASAVLTDVGSGGEVADASSLGAAVDEAQGRLAETERSIELWDRGGRLAYETIAPCLGAALGRVRDALVQTHRDVPEDLEEAQAMAEGASSMGCRER